MSEVEINHLYKVVKLSVRKFKFSIQTEEEIIQEAVIKCWQKFHTIQDERAISAWAAKIARNACIDFYRKDQKISFREESVEENNFEEKIEAPEAQLSSQYEKDVESVATNISKMEKGIRTDIALGYYVDGLSVKDICVKYELKQNTVLSHLRRMRLAFSKKFKDTYDFSYLSQSVQYSF